ncbi:hypothetical protein V5799_011455 [Amblyomma americanum]|uniref:Low-density lipoprotein receptor n=1 Tax=Amblyomma americanum TaxID=6943 RepID=A0AAQ4EH86_AMBAM
MCACADYMTDFCNAGQKPLPVHLSLHSDQAGVVLYSHRRNSTPRASICHLPFQVETAAKFVLSFRFFDTVSDSFICFMYLELVSTTETTDLLCGKDYTGTKSMVKASSSLTLRWTVSAREVLRRLGGFEIIITGFQQPESSGCAKGMTRCSNDRCVWSGFKCDGKDNCGDFSDERLCSLRVPSSRAQGGDLFFEIMARPERALLPPLFSKYGSVLARLWEYCLLETLVLPLLKLSRRIVDAIKARFAGLRRRCDSCIAMAANDTVGMQDEANESEPAEDCTTPEHEATTSTDWTPHGLTPEPGESLQSEADFQEDAYGKTHCNKGSLKAVHESPQESLEAGRSRRPYRRTNTATNRRGASVKPAGKGIKPSEESGAQETPLTGPGRDAPRHVTRASDSTMSLYGPSETEDVGDLATRGDSKVIFDQLPRRIETSQPFRAVHGCKENVALPPAEVRQPFGTQKTGSVANRATQFVSRTRRRPSSFWTKSKEPKEPYSRVGDGVAPKPGYTAAKTLTLSDAETRMSKPVSSVRIFTATFCKSKLKPNKFTPRGSARAEKGSDLLPNVSSRGKEGRHQSSGNQCPPASTLLAEVTSSERNRRQPSTGAHLLESPLPKTNAGNSRRQWGNRTKNTRSRTTPRDLPKTCELTEAFDDGVAKEPNASFRNRKRWSSWMTKRRGRPQANGQQQESSSQVKLLMRDSLNIDAGTTSRTRLRQVTPDIETTDVTKPRQDQRRHKGQYRGFGTPAWRLRRCTVGMDDEVEHAAPAYYYVATEEDATTPRTDHQVPRDATSESGTMQHSGLALRKDQFSMDETALSPCPGKPLSSSAGEYVTLTPVMPTYPHHQQGHLHEQLAVAVHPHHQPAVAMFPTTGFFCGGPPETPLEMPDLPAVAAPSPDFSVNSDSEDSSSDKGGTTDPFAPECKIPLPVPYSAYDYWLEPTFIRRRNERERQRSAGQWEGHEYLPK